MIDGEWWKYGAGMVLSAVGFIIKDAVRDSEMRKDIAESQKYIAEIGKSISELRKELDDMPCTNEILCVERRKSCNDGFRRELDAGNAQFLELKHMMQVNHSRLIDILMEIRPK